MFNHTIDDLLRFLRVVVNIWIHACQEILEDLQDKWLCDRKAHMISGICLVSKRAGVAAKTHAEILRQMIQGLL